MIRSMTGFGRAEKTGAGWRCGAEMRSVNGRFLEVRMKLPPGLLQMEEKLKGVVRSRFERGKVECTLTLSPESAEAGELAWNKELLHQYGVLLKKFKDVLGMEVQVTLGNLITIKDLLPADRWLGDVEGLEPLLMETVAEAVEQLAVMRTREGKALQAEMTRHVTAIRALLKQVRPLAEEVPAQYATRLRENLAKLAGGNPVNEERVIQEIAIMADRCDVSEEMARFAAHLEHLEHFFQDGGALGRKFEFLLQEVNREANTLASKSSDGEISRLVVEIKSELEKLREQIQNIE